ncbi:MAG TPA: hypothetical protein VL332_12390 [Candidatus Saccharimonadaceae bacterium]|nr:hypothetical protein [Candidatus Saccharimonadaceae bacterium]
MSAARRGARRIALASFMVFACALARESRAADAPTRVLTLLPTRATRSGLRIRLAQYADSARDGDPLGAGEARFEIGRSFARDGMLDSAIVNFEKSMALRPINDVRLALILALEMRQRPGDGLRAENLAREASRGTDIQYERNYWDAHVAWAVLRNGHADSAARVLASLDPAIDWSDEWHERFGRIWAGAGDATRAFPELLFAARLSRGRDPDVMRLLAETRDRLAPATRARADAMASRLTDPLDRMEATWGASLGAGRMDFTARDGFPLGCIVFPADVPRARACIVVMAPGDSLWDHDSLGVALRRAGLTVALLEPRGTGHSVAPPVLYPWSWRDHEVALGSRVAHDVLDCWHALARHLPIDTTACVVAGIGPTVTIAIESATLERRVRALLLISPEPAPSEQGLDCARLGKLQLPVFLQLSPEEAPDLFLVTDALYQAGNRRASRAADAVGGGRRAVQFRNDPKLGPRFRTWLDDAFASPAPRAPRPAKRP